MSEGLQGGVRPTASDFDLTEDLLLGWVPGARDMTPVVQRDSGLNEPGDYDDGIWVMVLAGVRYTR